MHTYNGQGATFHFNSDFSGDVIIQVGEHSVCVPAIDILEFVAYKYVFPEKTRRLERATMRPLLFGDVP